MAAATSITTPVLHDFLRSGFTYVPLDERGNLITRTIVVLNVTHKKVKDPTSIIHATALNIMGLLEWLPLCTCPRRYRTILESHEIKISPFTPRAELQAFAAGLQTTRPIDFSASVAFQHHETSPPPPYSPALLIKITHILESRGLSVTSANLSKLLTARTQALVAHETRKTEVLSVSSRAPYFRDINTPIRERNRMEVKKDEPSTSSLASVRVYPTGASSLTLPGLARCIGGVKVISYELLITPEEDSIFLMRRTKVQREQRTDLSYRFYHNSIPLIKAIKSPYVLTPNFLFSHPTKGVQYLVDSCQGDLFSFIEPYYCLFNGICPKDDPRVHHIVTTPIEVQIQKAITFMIQMTLGLQHMHQQQRLHNDVKPENVLLKNDPDEPPKVMLSDLDFVCTVSDGRSNYSNFGTLNYVRPNVHYKNMSTELYSLARTFWMDIVKEESTSASCMDIFNALQMLASLESPELIEKIASLKDKLSKLCKAMRTGESTKDGRLFLTYDDVVFRLRDMEALFPRRTASAAASPA